MERTNLKQRLSQIVDELVQQGVSLSQARREFERQFILASIRSNDGNLCRSARALGIHRNTLRNKITDLGIDASELTLSKASRRLSPSRETRSPL